MLMRLLHGAALSLFAILAVTTAAAAAKCNVQSVRLCDGCNTSIRWDVVQAPSGPAAEHSFCQNEWHSLNGLGKFVVVQPPHLGTVRFHDYLIAYRGEKLGQDTMVIRFNWLSASNRPMSAQVTYNINVVSSM